jgi:hypothetical protein
MVVVCRVPSAILRPNAVAAVQHQYIAIQERPRYRHGQIEAAQIEEPRPPFRLLDDALAGDALPVERLRHGVERAARDHCALAETPGRYAGPGGRGGSASHEAEPRP